MTTADSGRSRTRRTRRRSVAVVLAATTIAATGVLVGRDGAPVVAAAPVVATATVSRQDLVERTALAGTLGFGTVTTLSARSVGTLTWLPGEGETLRAGSRLYSVDARPVVLLAGVLPAYRRLAVGTEGEDVRQLEQGLRALGYTGFTVDSTYSSTTSAAVRRWQKDLGVPQTGEVDPADIVFGPEAARVATRKAGLGDQLGPGLPVLDTTGTTHLVTVALDASRQGLVRRDAPVQVELPDGRVVPGQVSSVGSVAKAAGEESGKQPTLEVVVTLSPSVALDGLDQAPVEVTVESERRPGVLTVPVTALLALAEGGYGVRKTEGSTSSVVPVQLGMFADGRVEVRGTPLSEGDAIEVPAS